MRTPARVLGTGVILGIGLFMLISITLGLGLPLALRAPDTIPPEGLLITVRPGEGAALIAQHLQSEGVIRSGLAFRVLAKFSRLEQDLKSGTYRAEPGMDAWAVLRLIASGKQALLRVTFPEGLTLSQTAEIAAAAGLASSAEFLAAARDPALLAELGVPGESFEGYLFPDTYFLPPAFGAAPTIRAMVAALRNRLAGIEGAESLSAQQLREKLVLASIVEREYRIADEAPVMASVFYNRLRIGMALQSCATVVYVMTEKLGKPHPEVLYERDIRIPHPYNTYLQPGLPPGPIANPGLTAIRAVFSPARTKYLYFRLIDPVAGRHHFSENLEEHIGAAILGVKHASGR